MRITRLPVGAVTAGKRIGWFRDKSSPTTVTELPVNINLPPL